MPFQPAQEHEEISHAYLALTELLAKESKSLVSGAHVHGP